MSGEKDLSYGETIPGFSIMTMCRAYTSLLIRNFLANTNTTVLSQPPYSPDLASADFFLFPKLKSILKGEDFRRFKKLRKIRRRSYARSRKMRTRTVSRSGSGFLELCISAGGE
jgi:hypothetical protein